MGKWLTHKQPLAPLLTPEHYELTKELLTNLQRELDHTLTTKQQELAILANSGTLTSQGSYRDQYLALIGPEHKEWPTDIIGHRSMYHRYNIERTRQVLLSLNERIAISTICANHNWDKNNWDTIRQELDDLGIYCTTGNLNNILRAGTIPTIPTHATATLDYTMGDKNSVRQEVKNDTIQSSLRVQGQWIPVEAPIPNHLKPHDNRFSKPTIQADENGELYIRYAYKTIIEEPPRQIVEWAEGVDLGKIKPFAGAINYGDKSYSTELTYSRELQRIKEKVEAIQKQMGEIRKLQEKRAALLSGTRAYPSVRAKWERAQEQLEFLRDQRTALKDQASWLVARDVVNHAVERGVGVIKLEELSWLESRGGLWDYARSQQRIEHVASLVGITVIKVDSRDTSHTNPFTGEKVKTNKDRELVLEDGPNIDRDWGAGLEVGCRPQKRGRKPATPKRESVKRGSNRDKHAATPKRPKSPSNRRKRKIMGEEGFPVTTTWAAFTVAVPLWSKRSADRHSLPRVSAGGNTGFTMEEYALSLRS